MKSQNSWRLADLERVQKNGLEVFSCFHCGGGSSMGYKLAGFDVVGGVEIDPQMMKLYRRNLRPGERFSYLMPIQKFNELMKDKAPSRLMNIDVLDGSPPCSSFSMSGSREDAWGKEKKFREGQAVQVLDDLFFDFIRTADILRPKMVVAENVKGLIMGNARGYVREIFKGLDAAGYGVQLFLLNSSRMGVPQARERTFFIGRRRDLGIDKVSFDFNDEPITAGEAVKGAEGGPVKKGVGPKIRNLWSRTAPGKSLMGAAGGSFFSWQRLHPGKPSPTVVATHTLLHWSECRMMSDSEVRRLQTFPDDYDFMDADPPYVCGMSVPPLMMKRVALEVARALASKSRARRPTKQSSDSRRAGTSPA